MTQFFTHLLVFCLGIITMGLLVQHEVNDNNLRNVNSKGKNITESVFYTNDVVKITVNFIEPISLTELIDYKSETLKYSAIEIYTNRNLININNNLSRIKFENDLILKLVKSELK